jgi:hypothetical protein
VTEDGLMPNASRMGTSSAWASCTLMPGLVQTQWDTLITRGMRSSRARPSLCRASPATGTEEEMASADRGGGGTTDDAAIRETRPPSGVRCDRGPNQRALLQGGTQSRGLPPVRCASAGAERPECGLRAGPAYVVIPQAKTHTHTHTHETCKSLSLGSPLWASFLFLPGGLKSLAKPWLRVLQLADQSSIRRLCWRKSV